MKAMVAYVPLLMFGVATDYNVFLLSRVREGWQRLGHVAPAVARASARTRRTITSAGAIMIVVFLGFTTDPDSTTRMAGFGLATIGFGLARDFFLSFAFLTLTGALDNVSVVIRGTLLQTLTPDDMRGRVAAVNTVFISSSNELGSFES